MKLYYNSTDGRVLHTLSGTTTPPGDWIEVPDQDLGDLADWRVIEGQLVRAVDLATAQDRARHEVNRARGAVRLLFITDLPGQELVYLDKERQAITYLADADPDLADYPGIMAEIGSTATNAHEVAQVYLNQAHLWRQISALIEGLAMTAHAAIDAASTAEECESIAAGIQAALLAALDGSGAPS